MSRSADVVLLEEVCALRAQLDLASKIIPLDFAQAVREFLASHGQAPTEKEDDQRAPVADQVTPEGAAVA